MIENNANRNDSTFNQFCIRFEQMPKQDRGADKWNAVETMQAELMTDAEIFGKMTDQPYFEAVL
jgi:hypothetical protein